MDKGTDLKSVPGDAEIRMCPGTDFKSVSNKLVFGEKTVAFTAL